MSGEAGQVGRRGIRPGLVCGLAGLVLLAAAQGGCQRALFAGEEARTPFESYDRRRGQDAVSYVWDPFKQRRPNLRQRLLPKE